ncbi:hypothetical protein MASR2M117_12990 [Paludibacter sp.]
MICPAGSIIRIDNFVLRDGTSKNKFFIVISNSDDNAITLLAMSTSNESGFYFDLNSIVVQHGAIRDAIGKILMYCIPKHKVIGVKNGFKFPKDTFFLAQYGFSELDCEKLFKHSISILDEISKEELNNLVYTLYSSPYIKKNF